MATQPPGTANITIERTSDYRHCPADQLLAVFLGTDYDLCFLTSAPRPIMQTINEGASEVQMHAEARIVEAVRVRMNYPGAQNALTSMVTAITDNPAVDLDQMERDIRALIDKARRSRGS